jgi:RimJ/RimL family protein N-acetyltransferase
MFSALRVMLPFIFDARLPPAGGRLHSEMSPRARFLKLGFQREGLARQYLQIHREWRTMFSFKLLEDDRTVG